MTNVPNSTQEAVTPARLPELPGCGNPSTTRYEIRATVDLDARVFGDLAGTVNLCAEHTGPAKTTLTAAGFTPFELKQHMEGRPCGSGMDFTGAEPVSLATRRRVAQAAAHVPVAAAPGNQPARVRIARANMLREISRLCFAVDEPALPAPRNVRFTADEAIAVELDTPTEAAEWAVVLGVAAEAKIEDTVDLAGGRWLVYTAHATWRGFPITVAACIRNVATQREAVPA